MNQQVLHVWQLQQAKARLSELIRLTAYAPQKITLRGEEVAVVLSAENYRRLTEPKMNLYEVMQASPFRDARLALTRDKSAYIREINFGD
jgi:prevent-host-death family protein